MKLLFLQDQVYLPSLGGGNKGSRLLLGELSRRGHRCATIAPAHTGRAGPANDVELVRELDARGIAVEARASGQFTFRDGSVRVDTLDYRDEPSARVRITQLVRELDPEWVVVADDKPRFLLECAYAVVPDRVVLLLQTVLHLPFGPHAARPSPRQAELVRQARARLVISRFLQTYVELHGQTDATVVRLPVYGRGPFPCHGRFDKGLVTLINPCLEKGLPIFVALARRFSDVEFGAVPTWGGDRQVLDELVSLANVRVREPADDIDEILRETRILLAPSLWPETFGYVVMDAMLRGIPVLASDVGGLAEAKLGVEYLLPVAPAVRQGDVYVSPPQEIAPWAESLEHLLTDEERYGRCSQASRRAAQAFVDDIDVGSIEHLLDGLSSR